MDEDTTLLLHRYKDQETLILDENTRVDFTPKTTKFLEWYTDRNTILFGASTDQPIYAIVENKVELVFAEHGKFMFLTDDLQGYFLCVKNIKQILPKLFQDDFGNADKVHF